MELIDNHRGNYRFLKGIAPYSGGVVSMPGFEIIQVRLLTPVPVATGAFEKIAKYLKETGRPEHSLCAMQLRIPEPLSFEGFKEFNDNYQILLENHGLLLGDLNPIARTNIASVPFISEDPSLVAFSYTVPQQDANLKSTFIVAGAGDLKDQSDLSSSAIVRAGETSPDSMQEKTSVVLEVMQDRLSGLQVSWEMVSCVNIYTKHPIHSLLADPIMKKIGPAVRQGVNWSYGVPPIIGLEFEMDVRGVRKEIVVEV